MNKTYKMLLMMAVLVAAVHLLAVPSQAIPAFSREYRINCSTCHQMNPPRLNSLGRNFQERGYQLPAGAERPAGTAKYSREDEQLALLERLPLALRIKNAGLWRFQAKQDETWVDLNTPMEMQLLAGGALFEDTSFYVNFPILTNGGVEAPILAYVQFNDLLRPGWANLRIGKFNILGLQSPGHRSLTVTTPKAPAVKVGNNPVALDEHQLGFDLFGRPNNGLFAYEVALVTGAGPMEEADDHAEAEAAHAHGGLLATDGNDFKDLYVRLSHSTRSRMHTVGVLGYFGKTFLGSPAGDGHAEEAEDAHAEAGEGVSDRFRIIGVDGEFSRGSWNLRSALYLGHHDDPFTTGISVDYRSVLSQLSYAFNRRWLGMIQYDQIISSDQPSLERTLLLPNINFLLLDNLRLSAEVELDLDDSDRNRAYFLIDLTM
ncbi:MAG: hypothetical protein ACI8P2_000887 [Candidatus Latescibacterota bacterium]|jgi:hypothetical protein